jgi:hypothetical protein
MVLKGWRTVTVIFMYLLFSGYVTHLAMPDLKGAAAVILAAGAGIFGSKMGNAAESRAENGKPKPT